MTKEQIARKERILKTIVEGDSRLYTYTTTKLLDEPLPEIFRREGLSWQVYDDEGEYVRPKTSREYMYVLAERGGVAILKLLQQEPDTSFIKILKEPEWSMVIDMLGVDNIMCHDEALKARDAMYPSEII